MKKSELKRELKKLKPKEWDEMVEFLCQLRAHEMVNDLAADFEKSTEKVTEADIDKIEDLIIGEDESAPEKIEKYMRKILKLDRSKKRKRKKLKKQ